MVKQAENYRRRLDGLAALDESDRKYKKQTKEEILKSLKGEAYWCNKCRDTHFHGDKKYKKHVMYSED